MLSHHKEEIDIDHNARNEHYLRMVDCKFSAKVHLLMRDYAYDGMTSRQR
jgi:hypothetical protein